MPFGADSCESKEPCVRRCSRVFTGVCHFFRTISKKTMQPDHQTSHRNVPPSAVKTHLFLGQKVKSYGHEAQKTVPAWVLHSGECWLLLVDVCGLQVLPGRSAGSRRGSGQSLVSKQTHQVAPSSGRRSAPPSGRRCRRHLGRHLWLRPPVRRISGRRRRTAGVVDGAARRRHHVAESQRHQRLQSRLVTGLRRRRRLPV